VKKSYLKVYLYSGKCDLLGTEFCIYEKVWAECYDGKKMRDLLEHGASAVVTPRRDYGGQAGHGALFDSGLRNADLRFASNAWPPLGHCAAHWHRHAALGYSWVVGLTEATR
jgi:hypothetical protein